jgi:hypothetical protein
MLVWCKKDGWQGLYKLVAVDRHNVTLNLPNKPIKFRLTVVREYFQNDKNLLPEFSSGNKLKIGLLPALNGGRPRIGSLSISKTSRPKAGLLLTLNYTGASAPL